MNTRLRGKHLISFEDWTMQEIGTVLRVSHDLKAQFALGRMPELLKGSTLFMIFFEQSTRTRNSLEAAMTQLGGHAHDLTPDKMQITHGESPKDTAKVLSRMGEGIAIRNCFYGVGNRYLEAIGEQAEVPVISMQDDVYHPLQAIADLLTIQEHFCSPSSRSRSLKGLKVAVCWAFATSHAKPVSVPQSQILLFPRYGMNVTVAHPQEFPLQPDVVEKARKNAQASGAELRFVSDMGEAMMRGQADSSIDSPSSRGAGPPTGSGVRAILTALRRSALGALPILSGAGARGGSRMRHGEAS